MTMKMKISVPKRGNTGGSTVPFVGNNKPFVGHIRPRALPFVGKKLPFVTNRQKQGGFTLVELIVTGTIASIMTVWAVSSWQSFVLDNRMVTQANEIMAELTLARSEAIKRRDKVVICSSSDLATCTNTDWALGWIIFQDANNSSQLDGGETIMRVHERLRGNTTLVAGAGIGTNFNFSRLGLAAITTGGSSNKFLLCDSRGTFFGRTIQLSGTGRPSIQRGCAP